MSSAPGDEALTARRTERVDLVGRLAGGFAHDLNNLLAVVRTHAEILQTDLAGMEAQIDAEAILGACMRAVDLTRQLLGVGPGRSPGRLRPDVPGLVREPLPLLQRLAGKGVSVSARLEARRAAADVDAVRLQQLLMDLLLDARDALGERGSVVVESADVTVGGRSFLRVSVADDAAAPSPTVRAHAFVPFFTTARDAEAQVLGLAPLREIAEEHRGELRVAAREGGGTRFELWLPSGPA